MTYSPLGTQCNSFTSYLVNSIITQFLKMSNIKLRAFNGSYSFSIFSIAVSILSFRIFKS
nr:MAG TPA: hypothetical protein [Caudoviricetes sp.]